MTNARWHHYEERQSAHWTTKIRDHAKIVGFPTEYSRVGWMTEVAVKCTDAEWIEIHDAINQEG
jgi:hypothetical protein